MAKDEEKTLPDTLESVKSFAHSLIIYDTGSTDGTIQLVKDFSLQSNIPLRLLQGVFEDFSTSRNKLLDYADTYTDIDMYLLLDAGDEVKGDTNILVHRKIDRGGFMVKQEWKIEDSYNNRFFNLRFLKPRTGWRFVGGVHEYIRASTVETTETIDEAVYIFQDRQKHGAASSNRFYRDYEILKRDHKNDPYEPRTLFYLAQTCACLNKHDKALGYYKKRYYIDQLGFDHERVVAAIRVGNLYKAKGKGEEAVKWYLRSFYLQPQIESLVALMEYHISQNQHLAAYMYGSIAFDLPDTTTNILNIDQYVRDYKRYNLLAICAWYTGIEAHKEKGILASQKAVAYHHSTNYENDKSNLQFYLEHFNNRKTDSSSRKHFDQTNAKTPIEPTHPIG